MKTSCYVPSFTPDGNTQYRLGYVASLHINFSVESSITVGIADV